MVRRPTRSVVLDQQRRPSFVCVTPRQKLCLRVGYERPMPQFSQVVVQRPTGILAGDPLGDRYAPQIVGTTMVTQSLAIAAVEELVEVRHRELTQASIDGFAIAQPRTVALGNRAPAATATKCGYYVRVVVRRAAQVNDQRRLTMNPERTGGNQRALDAVCAAKAQHRANRMHGLAIGLEVGGDRADERLDANGRHQFRKDSEFAYAQSQVLAACPPGEAQRACRSLHPSCARSPRISERSCSMRSR